MIDRPLLDNILQAIIAIGVVASTYQAWRAKKATQSTHRSVRTLERRGMKRDECLNAVHCDCCPENRD